MCIRDSIHRDEHILLQKLNPNEILGLKHLNNIQPFTHFTEKKEKKITKTIIFRFIISKKRQSTTLCNI